MRSENTEKSFIKRRREDVAAMTESCAMPKLSVDNVCDDNEAQLPDLEDFGGDAGADKEADFQMVKRLKRKIEGVLDGTIHPATVGRRILELAVEEKERRGKKTTGSEKKRSPRPRAAHPHGQEERPQRSRASY